MDSNKNLEVWLPVKGWESLYEVSNLGRVRSLNKMLERRGGERLVKGRILRQFERKKYLNVNLCHKYNRLCASVHRLVCEAFLINKSGLPIINHKDCNTLNNHVDNLEWCSHSHNVKHAWSNGRFSHSKLFKINQ